MILADKIVRLRKKQGLSQEEAEIEAEASKSKRSADEIRREREAKRIGERELAKQQKESAERGDLQAQYDEFAEVHGKDVAAKLFKKDSPFYRFAGKRIGRESLLDIYEDYVEFSGHVEKSAGAKKASKAERGTGSGSGSGANEGLSAAERAALDEWNKRYPGLKMTAKEWKGR